MLRELSMMNYVEDKMLTKVPSLILAGSIGSVSCYVGQILNSPVCD